MGLLTFIDADAELKAQLIRVGYVTKGQSYQKDGNIAFINKDHVLVKHPDGTEEKISKSDALAELKRA